MRPGVRTPTTRALDGRRRGGIPARCLAIVISLGMACLFVLGASPHSAAASSAARHGAPASGLTMVQRAAILAAMSPQERSVRARTFLDPRFVVQFYKRVTVAAPDSSRSGAQEAASPASTSGHDLTISVSSAYEEDNPCCYYDLEAYFEWAGGGDCCQTTPDHLALAWGDGLQLFNDYAYGYYYNGTGIPMYRDDMAINEGLDYDFAEWKPVSRATSTLAHWGYLLATIHELSYKNVPTDVEEKYVHTYSSTSVGISIGAPAPSIFVSNFTDNWSLVDYEPVTY